MSHFLIKTVIPALIKNFQAQFIDRGYTCIVAAGIFTEDHLVVHRL